MRPNPHSPLLSPYSSSVGLAGSDLEQGGALASIKRELALLWQRGVIECIDWEFARLMVELNQSPCRATALAAALASRTLHSGDSCLELRRFAEQRLLKPDGEQSGVTTPSLGEWREALFRASVVGRPGECAPLIYERGDRLYLYRYWQYEALLAAALSSRMALAIEVDEARLKADLDHLFGSEPAALGQKQAAAMALLNGFCIISGGPGTGKTTTLVKILLLLLAQFGSGLRISLAAPTGKAAARMQEAIGRGKSALRKLAEASDQRGSAQGLLRAELIDAIPDRASTLHRLLGPEPDGVYFRHHRENPLGLEVLVIDEASMVDLALMAKTVAALPPKARLILLGDRDQLASVEAGAVFADLCSEAGSYDPAWSERLAALTGEPLAVSPKPLPRLNRSIALLRYSYRFGSDSGIGQLARAVNEGQLKQLHQLAQAAHPDVLWAVPTPNPGEELLHYMELGYRDFLAAVETRSPEKAFAAFSQFQVLSPQRRGGVGVEALNGRWEERRRSAQRAQGEWYPGRAIMVTRNDHTLHLYNGDIGIALPDPTDSHTLRVYFQTPEGGWRSLAVTRLPNHEPAFAITVHKSQGSEFDAVLLVVPREESNVINRELIYTAITRAKRRVTIYGQLDDLMTAAGRSLKRASGLRARLLDEVAKK